MREILLVAAGGCVGAVARYAVNGGMQRWLGPGGFPAATLAVNVAGCLAIGLLMGLAIDRQSLTREMQLLLVTGCLGSLTTFSAFGHETVELMRQGDFRTAFGSVAANLCLGFAAVWTGRQMVRLLGP